MKNLKNLLSPIFVLIITALLIASCSSKPEQLSMIPDDAFAVVSFDVKSILLKSELDKSDNPLRKLLKEIAGEENAPAVIKEILNDPSESPISLKDEMFLFVTQSYVGFTAKINDEKKMKKLFQETDVDVYSEKSYNTAELDPSTVCVWDKEKFLFISSLDYYNRDKIEEYAQSLFTAKKNKSILSNPGFSDFYGKRKDVSAWFCFDNIARSDKKEISSELGFDLSELEVGLFLSFDKGQASLKLDLLKANEDFNKKIKDFNYGNDKISGNLFKYLPEQSIIAIVTSLNGEKLYDMISGMGNRDFESIEREMKSENIDIKNLFSSFKGDIIFSLYDVTNRPVTRIRYDHYSQENIEVTEYEPTPAFTVLAETKDDYAVKTIIEKMKEEMGESITQIESGIYSVNIEDMKIVFGTAGKYIFFTTDESNIKNIKNGYSKSLADSNLKKEISGKLTYAYMDLNLDNYPEAARKMIDDMMGGEYNQSEAQLIKSISSNYLKSVNFSASSETSAELVWKFADDKENSAKILIGLITDVINDVINRFM